MDILKSKLNLKNSKQLAIIVLTFIASIITFYVVYASIGRNVSLRSPESNPNAANPSCLLNLSLYKPTPTPSPTPSVCVNCQYQTDVFWGPVINSFAGGLRYTATKRLITSAANYTSYPGCVLAATTPQPAPVLPSLTTECQDPVSKAYLKGTVDTSKVALPNGYIKATITNNSANCTYPVGLASYKASGSNIDTQNLYDYKIQDLGPKQTVTIFVKSPMNNDAPSCHLVPTPPPTPSPTPIVACTNWGVNESSGSNSKIVKISQSLTSVTSVKTHNCSSGFCEIESMDYDPARNMLFVVPNVAPTKGLYSVNVKADDGITDGTLTLYKAFSPSFTVLGLAFKNTDSTKVWLWRNGSGLYTMNMNTGATSQEFAYSANNFESIVWDNAGKYMYAARNKELWRYDPAATTNKLVRYATNLPGKTDSMDFAPANYLDGMLVGYSEGNSNFFTYNVNTKTVVKNYSNVGINGDALAVCIPN